MMNKVIEASLLSAAINDEGARDLAVTRLTEAHILDDAHRDIFSALRYMNENAMAVDVITLAQYLDSKGKLEKIGGLSYLGTIARSVGTAENIKTYIELIEDSSVSRHLIELSQGIQAVANSDLSSSEKIAKIEGRLSDLSDKTTTGPVLAKEVLGEMINEIDERSERTENITGLTTGIDDLDEVTMGLQRKDLIIIAGRPSQGKTSLAENIYTKNAGDGKSVLFFSLEMGATQILERMFASRYSVDFSRIRSGDLSDSEWTKLTSFVSEVTNWNAYIDDEASLSINEICARARAINRKGKLDMVVIDYLQLIAGGQGENQVLRIADISRKLKGLAKELDVPVILLSQLSRAVEQRQDKRPIMSDLRDSGAIEQDADIILFVYRDEYYNPDSPAKGMAELLLRKHRNGPCTDIFVRFEGRHCRFKNNRDDYEDYYSHDGYHAPRTDEDW